MKLLLKYLLALPMIAAAVVTPLHAETIVLTSSDPEHWVTVEIAEDEAVFFDYLENPFDSSAYSLFRLEMNGVDIGGIEIMPGGAIAGPATVIIRGYWDGFVVTLRRVQGSGIQTVVAYDDYDDDLGDDFDPSELEAPEFEVPSGKTLRLLPFDGPIRVVTGEDFAELDGPGDRGFDLTGPLTVRFGGEYLMSDKVYSFFLVDNHTTMTTDGYLQGPSGSFEVLVETSDDLQNWQPTMIQRTNTEEKRAFFRLRLRP